MMAATNAPAVCASEYGSTLRHGKPLNVASAIVTAGLMWPPDTRAATYTPKTTPRPQPHATESWSPRAPSALVTTWATTPTPKMIRMKVPRNSAINSPRYEFFAIEALLGRSGCPPDGVRADARNVRRPGQRPMFG